MQTEIKLPAFFPDNIDADGWFEVEVHPVQMINGAPVICDGDPDDKPDFYTVYLHIDEGGMVDIADLDTLEQAQQLAEVITKAARYFVKP